MEKSISKQIAKRHVEINKVCPRGTWKWEIIIDGKSFGFFRTKNLAADSAHKLKLILESRDKIA